MFISAIPTVNLKKVEQLSTYYLSLSLSHTHKDWEASLFLLSMFMYHSHTRGFVKNTQSIKIR